MRDVKADILNFWFDEIQPEQWFQKSDDFDRQIIDRFATDFDQAVQGKFDGWTDIAEGSLALIILLDQFSRNMFRDTPKAFSGDDKALAVARQSVEQGFDQTLEPSKRSFMYLPFEHSEDMDDQKRCVELFEAMKEDHPLGYDYALRHMAVIEQFGRFPHRNAILGRENTDEEAVYLAQPGAGF